MELQIKPKLGRPFGIKEMKEYQIAMIVEGFDKTLVLSRAAGYADIHPHFVKTWLMMGGRDAEMDLDTPYAQLYLKVSKKMSEKAALYIEKIEKCPKNYNALTWLLSTCLKDDYGTESDEYKYLVDLYSQLREAFNRFTSNPQISTGSATDGTQKLDSGSN